MSDERKRQILDTLIFELERQSRLQSPVVSAVPDNDGLRTYKTTGSLDIIALASAVERELESEAIGADQIDEGKTPDELNAANDE